MTVRACTHPRAQHQHGTRAAYTRDGCRCFPCRIGNSQIRAIAAMGLGWSDPGLFVARTGTIRRLQALHVIGWSERAIADRLGCSKQAVGDLRRHPSDRILAATAARVEAVYDELWNQTPAGPVVTRTRRWAARNGWVPPLAWDDDDIDNPDAQPNTPGRGGWELKPCGTQAAARRHMRRGEPMCGACRKANARREDAA